MNTKKEKLLRHEMDAAFKWLTNVHGELSDAKVKMICTYLHSNGQIETVGSGDQMFYFIALTHQIRAARLDAGMETDEFFKKLREAYDMVEEIENE